MAGMSLLELRKVSKSFPGVQALFQVDLDVQAGEVHALIGENGAGKSTLIKLLSGVYTHDSGTIRFDNALVAFTDPQDSQRAGIFTLYQEFNLLPHLTVAENIFLGAEPRHKHLPFIDWHAMQQQTRRLLDMLDLAIQPDARVGDLSAAEQQMIELAKTLHANPKLLIMDEPTSSLSYREVNALFRLIRRIKAQGISVIYVSHRLDDVLAIADRITVLRDGRRITTIDAANSTIDQLARLMLGRAINQRYLRRAVAPGAEILRVEGLTRRPDFEDVSFTVYTGEIVGLAGLVGSGRSAVARAIFGFAPPDSGMIYIDARSVSIRSPRDAVALGMGMLPEDRQQQALLLEMSARENISLARLGQSGLLVDLAAETTLAETYIKRLRIKVPDPEAKAKYLSGGTQQKLILSRWLAVHPRILIFDEPTRGIDIGAKVEIYRLLGELAHQGVTILMVSSELSEIVGLCDRVFVMHAGRLIAALDHDQLTEEALLQLMMGESP
ncbi:MAG: sugar ABC transporter ATP-binding protein [Anaerolineae bacterium]|nr:sugar ABC transporter ATP-binding protein [Anaerolineae bacterium]